MTTQKFITHFLSVIVGVVIGVGGLILYLKMLESPPPPPPPKPPYSISKTEGGRPPKTKLFFIIDESFVINGVTVNEGNCSVTYDDDEETVTFPKSVVMGTYLTLYTDCQRIVKVVVDTSKGIENVTFR